VNRRLGAVEVADRFQLSIYAQLEIINFQIGDGAPPAVNDRSRHEHEIRVDAHYLVIPDLLSILRAPAIDRHGDVRGGLCRWCIFIRHRARSNVWRGAWRGNCPPARKLRRGLRGSSCH